MSDELEPIVLFDVTTSMNWPVAEGSDTSRRGLLQEAFPIIVSTLAAADSQAEKEADGGGLMVVTFSTDHTVVIGDINPNNYQKQWDKIKWGGGTLILPGFKKLLQNFMKEFADEADKPTPAVIVLTDGEATDYLNFSKVLAILGNPDAISTIKKFVDPELYQLLLETRAHIYVKMAIFGYGSEHDTAYKQYDIASQANPGFVSVQSFAEETDPNVVAKGLLAMMA